MWSSDNLCENGAHITITYMLLLLDNIQQTTGLLLLSLSLSLSQIMPTTTQLEFTPEGLDEKFKCPVCFEEMTEVFTAQCEDPVCDKCALKVASCPSCQGPMDGAKKHDIFTERCHLMQKYRQHKCNACGELTSDTVAHQEYRSLFGCCPTPSSTD